MRIRMNLKSMKSLVVVWLVIGTVLPAHAENVGDERDMICSGPYRTERVGYCHIPDDDKMLDAINASCSIYRACVVKARVKLGWINEGYKNYEIIRIYSVKRGK
jgi:hypothetical protein